MKGVASISQHPFLFVVGIALGLLSSLYVLGRPSVVTLSDVATDNSYSLPADAGCSKQLKKSTPIGSDGGSLHRSVYIAVRTSNSALKSRAKAIHDTWGKTETDIEYYIAGPTTTASKLPIVNLFNVIDPPHTDIFSTLIHIYNTYIDQFNWFMIANDKLYVHIQRLNKYLSSLDPSGVLYVGAPDYIPDPDDRSIFKFKISYCKSNTGIIISNVLLHKLAPYLKDCWKDDKKSNVHHDISLGKCIKKYAGVQCMSSNEIDSYFYEDYSEGEVFLHGGDRDGMIKNAITTYPFKLTKYMYKIHQFYLEVEIKEHKKEKQILLQKYKQIRNITRRLSY